VEGRARILKENDSARFKCFAIADGFGNITSDLDAIPDLLFLLKGLCAVRRGLKAARIVSNQRIISALTSLFPIVMPRSDWGDERG
jgi:hypothetical protein